MKTVFDGFRFQMEEFKARFPNKDDQNQRLFFLNASTSKLTIGGVYKKELKEFEKEFEIDPTKHTAIGDWYIVYMRRKKGVKPNFLTQLPYDISHVPTI